MADLNGAGAPAVIQPAPLDVTIRMTQVMAPMGPRVALIFNTNQGESYFFISHEAAEAMANDLLRMATGLVVSKVPAPSGRFTPPKR